ncbi:MAG TPA: tRNA (adenosine(37)-N6)-threonylcarbamoyltransferase complex ATPase subunit type 1 TsaE [Gammaproteobacteria bacterium]|nr:tRNA (adenosine(37)-N6)-threonylcarbamoyltransferase complex ATPase subunit type 1 TsaE [Gammaproteobacteria bacterium]|tara:strand:- start:1853 stop:2344 length:492 start_codon:yes stop_codon:yes gene_type:complete
MTLIRGATSFDRILADQTATEAFALELLGLMEARTGLEIVVYLQGQLGAGKTTLVRGLLRHLGFAGAVKSPTYTLLEPYSSNGLNIYHFDLYRLNSPEELEFVGFDEIFSGSGLKLIEWPQKGMGWLPQPNCIIDLEVYSAPSEILDQQQAEVFQRRVRVSFV